MRFLGLVLFSGCVASSLIGCGGGSGVPTMTPERESGQSGLMDQTFAGKNKCNPKSADRPFVVEWDATDMSSFESFAANDVVVVKYEGCELRVLDHCRDDSIKGKLGVYRPVDWTTGQLETIDISNEGELYAKLPLGAASLGGRVQGGEKFHMEYYVSGTRNSSRTDVYQADLEKLPSCKGATHFVYGYNLGAFALGSVKSREAEAGGSLYGFGVGGSTKSKKSADKKGGDLTVCRSDVATEVSGCKSPIRLILREIQTGADPEREAQKAPDTDESLNAAGAIAASLQMSDEARAHLSSAQEKFNSRDGKGCVTELNAHDQLNPKHKSTDPKTGLGLLRSMCVMLSGQCDAGKQLLRKTQDATGPADQTPESIDSVVDAVAGQYCQGANMSERDQFITAVHTISNSTYKKVDLAACKKSYDTYMRLKNKVKPRDENDSEITNAWRLVSVNSSHCFAKAGDCDTAFKVFDAEQVSIDDKRLTPQENRGYRVKQFESIVTKCSGKVK